jgi:hypothetical protein
MDITLQQPRVLKAITIILIILFVFDNKYTSASGSPTLQNSFFRVTVTPGKGMVQVYRSNGDVLLTGAIVAANTSLGEFTSLDPRYRTTVKILPFIDATGKGKKMDIYCTDSRHELDLQLKVSLYDTLQAIVFEVSCRNVSDKSLIIQSIEPMRAIKEETGSLKFQDPVKCLTNGAMYYDAGMIHTFGEEYIKPEPYGETKGGKMVNNMLAGNKQTVQSWRISIAWVVSSC